MLYNLYECWRSFNCKVWISSWSLTVKPNHSLNILSYEMSQVWLRIIHCIWNIVICYCLRLGKFLSTNHPALVTSKILRPLSWCKVHMRSLSFFCTNVSGLRYAKMSSQVKGKTVSNALTTEYKENLPLSSSYENAMQALSSLITRQKRGEQSQIAGRYGKMQRMSMYLKVTLAGLKFSRLYFLEYCIFLTSKSNFLCPIHETWMLHHIFCMLEMKLDAVASPLPCVISLK